MDDDSGESDERCVCRQPGPIQWIKTYLRFISLKRGCVFLCLCRLRR